MNNQNTKPNKIDSITFEVLSKEKSIDKVELVHKYSGIKKSELKKAVNTKPNIYRDIDEEFWKIIEEYEKFSDCKIDTAVLGQIKDFIHKQIDKTNREWEKKLEDKIYSLDLVDDNGKIKEMIGLFVINGELSTMCDYGGKLGLRPVIKKLNNLLKHKE